MKLSKKAHAQNQKKKNNISETWKEYTANSLSLSLVEAVNICLSTSKFCYEPTFTTSPKIYFWNNLPQTSPFVKTFVIVLQCMCIFFHLYRKSKYTLNAVLNISTFVDACISIFSFVFHKLICAHSLPF